jgi:hypothetical protein
MAWERLYEFRDNAGNLDQAQLFNLAIRDPNNPAEGPGMCMAISCDWAKASLQYSGVTRRSQLNPWRWPIIQSAYVIAGRGGTQFQQHRRVVVNSGLTVVNGNGNGQFLGTGSSDAVLGYLRGVAGHCVFALRGNGGHALGYRHQAGSVEFVDPNFGHWKGDNRDELLNDVVQVVCDNAYSDLLTTMFLFVVRL